MKKIIDLSQFNAVSDWQSVAKNVDGVIIRCGYRGYGSAGTLVRDARYRNHMAGALANGVPVGVYFLSQAVTEAEAAAEADFVHSLVKNYSVTLPVYIDSEWSHTPHTGRADTITAARRTDCVLAFCERIRALGYTPGVYASESWFGSMLQLGRLSGLNIWCAKYGGKPGIRYDGWQYTDAGTVPGISSKVDVSKFGAAVELQQYAFALDDIERIAYIPMAGTKGESVSAAARRVRWNGRAPDVLCNAELFSMVTYKPASGVVAGGAVQRMTEALGVAFVNNRKPVLSWKNNVRAPDWLAAYPLLVRDGKVCVTAIPSGLGGAVARTALAWNDTHCAVVFVKASDGADLFDFADAIAEAGYTFAANYDGGGSTAVVTPDTAYDQGRPVRGKFGVWLKGGTGNKLARDAAANSGTMQRDSSKTGGVTMTVTANGGLRLRKAAPDGALVSMLGKGTAVQWYGYYCIKGGAKWLYVRSASGKQGYASAEYLKE